MKKMDYACILFEIRRNIQYFPAWLKNEQIINNQKISQTGHFLRGCGRLYNIETYDLYIGSLLYK